MQKTLLLLALVMLCSFHAFSQKHKGTVSGRAIDSTNEAVVFATVSLISDSTHKPVKNIFTDEQGRFKITEAPYGSYKLVISMVGYAPASKAVKLDAAHPEKDLGVIEMHSSSKQLKGVTVNAQKPILQVEDNKIVYNVDNDLTVATETASEVLRKVPMVSVDLDGTIRLRGSENFKVQVNGKSTGFIAKNPKEALQNFPASLVKKIEVITEPSAKQDAEGSAGIINIITTKKFSGYNASVNAYYNTRGQLNGSASLNVKLHKFGISGYYGAGHYKNNYNSSFSRENLIPGFHSYLNQDMDGRYKGLYQYGNLELSYDIDSSSSVSLYGNLSGSHNNNHGTTDVTNMDGEKTVTQAATYYSTSHNKHYSYSTGLDYQKTFKTPEQKLVTSLYFDNDNGNTFSDNKQYYDPGADRFYKNANDNSDKQSTVKIDYTQPFKKKQKLEAGVKMILRKINSDYENTILDSTSGKYVLNPKQSNVFNYHQNVFAAYSTYRFSLFKDYSLQLGTRVEHTNVGANFKSSDTTLDQDYTNLIPTLNISRTFKKVHHLSLSYSRRLQRPWIWYLNPYVDNDDPKNIRYGNPNLDPEFTNSFSLNYNGFMKGKSLNLSLYYNYTNNSIQPLTTIDSTNGVATTTYYNIGQSSVTGLNFYTSTQITSKWTLRMNLNLNYTYVKSNNQYNLSNQGVSGFGYMNMSYNILETLKAEANIYYYSGRPNLQGRYTGNYDLGFGLRKSIFKNKAAITLSLQEPFRKYMSRTNKSVDPTFIQTSTSNYPSRALRIGFNWHFGKLKQSVSRKVGIQNQDLKSGGSSSGGGE